MNKQKQAFTLVELIVVITILAILGTIAIMAFGGYSKNARDSRRMSDLNNITKVLELFKLQSGNYPDPTDTFAVTYSGATAWTQGSFGDQTVTNVGKMDKKPTDPLTGSEYTYSVTNTKGEFQVAAIYEGDNLSANGFINQTYAAETLKTIVKGTYNGKFVKTNTGSTTYILGAPSIITSEITSVDIETIANNKSFVYTNYSNLPSSYKTTSYTMTGGFDFGGGAGVVLFEGNLGDLGTSTGKLEFANNLNAFYSVDPLDSNVDYKSIVELDTSGNQAGAINLVNNYLSNKVGGVIADVSNTTSESSPSSSILIDFETENGYSVSQGVWSRTNIDKNQGDYSIKSGNNTDNSESCFEIVASLPSISQILFDYKISSEYDYDFLTFYVNNVFKIEWSGEELWATHGDIIASGNYTFKWCYSKDSSESVGQDTAWVDNIRIAPSNGSIAGICGGDNNEILGATPTNLCNNGTPSVVTDGGVGNNYTWSCNGLNGGTNASCSASHITINGVCSYEDGLTLNYAPPSYLCDSGIPSEIIDEGIGNNFTWSCNGLSGGTNSSCSAIHGSVNGVCSNQNGINLYQTPTNLCSVGEPSIVTDGGLGNNYTWSCAGYNGGNTANCSSPHKLGCQSGDQEITLENGQTWKCLNVGATTVWDGASTADASCNATSNDCNAGLTWRGNFYQWGKNDITYTGSWAGYSTNGWGGLGTTPTSGTFQTQSAPNQALMRGPCDAGWHIPTAYEWQLACRSILGKSNCVRWDNSTSMKLALKLGAAGFRWQTIGTYGYLSEGMYWSSTPGSTYEHHMTFGLSGIYPYYNFSGSAGLLLRCVKD